LKITGKIQKRNLSILILENYWKDPVVSLGRKFFVRDHPTYPLQQHLHNILHHAYGLHSLDGFISIGNIQLLAKIFNSYISPERVKVFS